MELTLTSKKSIDRAIKKAGKEVRSVSGLLCGNGILHKDYCLVLNTRTNGLKIVFQYHFKGEKNKVYNHEVSL
jgi:hypothetical protein